MSRQSGNRFSDKDMRKTKTLRQRIPLQLRQHGAVSPIAQLAGIDAVQTAVHPDLQLVGILRAHPVAQLLDRGSPSSAIFLEHLEQRPCPLQPPSIAIIADTVGCFAWHVVPSIPMAFSGESLPRT